MRIGILTLPLHTNYGGILQAYALQTVLERMGHQVDVLQKNPSYPHSKWIMPVAYLKRALVKILLKKKVRVFIEKRQLKEKTILERETSKFIKKYLHLRVVQKLTDVKAEDYDAIVVGSDQIWRKPYFISSWHAPMKDAFLDFTKHWNIKRMAFAASFGVDNLNEYSSKDLAVCKEGLEKFDEVSVRELSGIDVCQEYFGINAFHMPDPTLLLTKQDYLSILERSDSRPSPGNMLCYILDKTPFKEKVIEEISRQRNLKPFFTNVDVDNFDIPVEERIQPPVEQWLRGFKDAEFIVTDSFHACVFSIIFNKPFIVIGNMDRGMARFNSLLKTFGLEDKLIDESTQTDVWKELPSDMSKKIESLQSSAYRFLKKIN